MVTYAHPLDVLPADFTEANALRVAFLRRVQHVDPRERRA